MASLKAKQDDLRRLMKERRENLKNQKNKVDSPFAKYNSVGELFCIICNIQIKSNGLWAAHVAGKIHKENALKKKKGTAEVTSSVVPRNVERESEIQPPAVKRMKIDKKETFSLKSDVAPTNVERESEMQPPAAKRMKIDEKETFSLKSEPVKPAGKLALLDAYSSSSEDDESETPAAGVATNNTSNNALPKDFFDATASVSNPPNKEQPPVEENKPTSVNSVEALPEGFFDDPVLDAKARHIEYKDPIEEEWERYQKAIAEETNVSKTIIEEDLEESTLERDITEIDQQIILWEKAKKLQSLAEEASTVTPSTDDKDNASGSTDEELEEDDLLDWRSKGVKKR